MIDLHRLNRWSREIDWSAVWLLIVLPTAATAALVAIAVKLWWPA